MLSFMKEEDNKDKAAQVQALSGDVSSEKETSESAEVSSLNKTLSEGGSLEEAPSQDFLAPSSSGKKVKYSTMILGAVFLIGAASLFLMIKKFGPAEAQAGLSQEELQIESAIAKLSGSKAAINDKMNDIVDRISGLSKVEQVSVDELKRNPFIQDTSFVGVDVKALIDNSENFGGAGLKLWSVMESGDEKSCMINDRVYKIGDRVGNYDVKRIGEGFVELAAGQKILVLRMSK